MNKKKALFRIVLVTLAFHALLFCSPPHPTAASIVHSICSLFSHTSFFLHANHSKIHENRKLLLLIIDFDDFMCMNCLDSFLSFCFSLPPSILRENTWGILVLGKEINEKQQERSLKIAQKKLRGFIQTHQIPFPIFIDSQHQFHSLALKGTSFLILETGGSSFTLFSFPLKKEESERIKELLADE